MRRLVLERGGAPCDEPPDRARRTDAPGPARAAMPAASERRRAARPATGGSDAAWAVRSAVRRTVAWTPARGMGEEELQVWRRSSRSGVHRCPGPAALPRLREGAGRNWIADWARTWRRHCGRGIPAHVLRAESDIASVDVGWCSPSDCPRDGLATAGRPRADGRSRVLHVALTEGRSHSPERSAPPGPRRLGRGGPRALRTLLTPNRTAASPRPLVPRGSVGRRRCTRQARPRRITTPSLAHGTPPTSTLSQTEGA